MCLPAKVTEAYDPARNAIGCVKCLLHRKIAAPDGGYQDEELPEIYDVPVAWPTFGGGGGAGFQITFPIAVGDVVLLVFPDYDTQAWRFSGQMTEPGDPRAHHLSGAIALPCSLRTIQQPMTSFRTNALELGHTSGHRVAITDQRTEVGGATDAAALASKVDALASTVNALIALYNAHTHASSGASSPATAAGAYTGGASASAVLKVGS